MHIRIVKILYIEAIEKDTKKNVIHLMFDYIVLHLFAIK
jgi:hypothetical protein